MPHRFERGTHAPGDETLASARGGNTRLQHGKRRDPARDSVERFRTHGCREAGTAVRMRVRLAGDGPGKIRPSGAEGQPGGRIAALLQTFELPVRVAGLAVGRKRIGRLRMGANTGLRFLSG